MMKVYISVLVLCVVMVACSSKEEVAVDQKETHISPQTQIATPRSGIKDKVVEFINQALPTPTVIASLDSKPNLTSTPQIIKDSELTKNKPCILTGGETVESGWRGKDTGSNYCNNCLCNNGLLGCTKIGCFIKQNK